MNDRRSCGVRRRIGVGTLAAFAFLLTPVAPVGAAEDVTAAELRRLAAEAVDDLGARAALRDVRSVDGRPVDLGRALATDDENELRARLRTLAADTSTGTVDEAHARDEARRILDSRTFKPAKAPRPFRGALRRLGEWLRPVLEPIGRFFQSLTENTPAGWAVIAFVLLAAVLVARNLVHRRTLSAVQPGRRGRRGHGHDDDPDALERAAEAAERAGELDRAVRLRFRAGLLRLDRAGAVDVPPSLTTGRLTQLVTSPTLRDLAATFDAVAYGGRPAEADDVAAARAGWPRVLEEAGRK